MDACPVDLVMRAQTRERCEVQAFPYAPGLSVTQAPPANHAAAEAQFLGQVLPPDTGLQDEHDAIECRPVIHPRPTTFGQWNRHRQQRLQGRPKCIVNLV